MRLALPPALACALLIVPACARMVETRTDTVLAREPGTKIEAWHPSRDQLEVSLLAEGDTILASVQRLRACTLALGERRRISTHADKSANVFDLTLEGVGGALLMVGSAQCGTNTDSSSPRPEGPDVSRGVCGGAFLIGAALGTAFVIDLASQGHETTERTEIVKTGVQLNPACEVRPGEGAQLSFVIDQGPTLSCRVDAKGMCRAVVDPSVWQASNGVLAVDVLVDGRLVRHEQLRRTPP